MATFRKVGANYDAGLRAPHYTNGRLLTAEDLQRDQQATLDRLALLGAGVGTGVIEGLRVTAVAAGHSLRVTAGVGITPKGDAVRLVTESIILPVQPVTANEEPVRRSGRFEACNGKEGNPTAPIDSGAYLLTVAPAARLEGSAPHYTCDGTMTSACANQWEVEGVEFKIIRLLKYQAPADKRRQRNRNLLAHWFYGSAALDILMDDPLGFDQAYSGFTQIAADDLSECDLPLAAFVWDDGQIVFIDEWAVRRRLHHPYPGERWRANIGDRRVAEGEARFAQFQDQLADLQVKLGDEASEANATTHFAHLPPVGLLPVNPYDLLLDVMRFEETLKDEQRRRMKAEELSAEEVRGKVREGLLKAYSHGPVFTLARFFGAYYPLPIALVHEDEIHNRLQQSWVQPSIPLLTPGATSDIAFEMVLDHGEVIHLSHELTVAHIETLLAKTSYAGTYDNLLAHNLVAKGRLFGGSPTPIVIDRSGPAPVDAAIEKPGRRSLVEILLIDGFIDPYRDQLVQEIEGRIDDAITLLSEPGITGEIAATEMVDVAAEIAYERMLKSYLTSAYSRGRAEKRAFPQQPSVAALPVFYVAFVRHYIDRETGLLQKS